MADRATLPVSTAAKPDVKGDAEPAASGTAAEAASGGGGREMRQRKAGPPMLSSGPPLPAAGKAKPKTTKPKRKRAPGAAGQAGKAGRAAAARSIDGDEDMSLQEDYSADGAIPEDDASGQVFCICLGQDDGRPMLGCESCDNWFHFDCIGLSANDVPALEAFFCNLCEQAGAGKTRWKPGSHRDTLPDGPAAHSYGDGSAGHTNLPPLPPLPSYLDETEKPLPPLPPVVGTPSDSEPERDDGDYSITGRRMGGYSTDEDYDAGDGGPKQRRLSSSVNKRKRRVIEDEDDMQERQKRKPVRPNVSEARPETSKRAPISPGKTFAVAERDRKLREHCIDSLETSLVELCTASGSALPALGARLLAERIEAELFDRTAEFDPTSGERRRQNTFIAQMRKLFHALKKNEYFRSRVMSAAIGPAEIVSMDQVNLLTPEERAAQEALKERALSQSVKLAQTAPKTRLTHKGEEVIDQFDQAVAKGQTSAGPAVDTSFDRSAIEQQEASAADGRERSMSISVAGTPVAGFNAERFSSPPAPVTGHEGRHSSSYDSSKRDHEDLVRAVAEVQDEPHSMNTDGTESFAVPAPPTLQHRRSESLSKTKLDLDKIFGAYKAPAVQPAGEAQGEAALLMDQNILDPALAEMESTAATSAKSEIIGVKDEYASEYDPFQTSGRADDDFDALFKDEGASNDAINASKADAENAKPEIELSHSDLSILPTIWTGAVISPEEGGYPATAVQVAGPTLPAESDVWARLLPKGQIDLSSRIDVRSANDYLVQSKFTSTRSTIVIALLPAGAPDEEAARKQMIPTHSKALTKHAHLVGFFSDKRRYGVCPPTGDRRAAVRDHYIVPLRKTDPLPDWIELMDAHAIGETGQRPADLMLSVLVVSKSALGPLAQGPLVSSVQTAEPAMTASPDSASSAPAANFASSNNSSAPLPDQSPIPGLSQVPQATTSHTAQPLNIDQAALQSLLANPGLLQALNAPQAAISPQNGAPPPGLSGLAVPPGVSAPGSGGWMPPGIPLPPFGHPGLANGGWQHSAGSPTWQGGGSVTGHQSWMPPSGPRHPPPFPPSGPSRQPGFIPPERIKEASAQAREMAERIEREKRDGRNGGRDRPRHDYIDERSDRPGFHNNARDNPDRSNSFDRRNTPHERRNSRDYRDDRNERDNWSPREGPSDRGSYSRYNEPRRSERRDEWEDKALERRDSNDRRPPNSQEQARTREKAGNTNQMHAGIADKGWGPRRG